jgi:hypothetical protein
MRVLAILLGYIASIVALAGPLMGGVFWLLQPDPSLTREAKAAPIPQRIAESIERKKAPIAAAEPVPAKAPMLEANVALTTQLVPTIKIRELSVAPAKRWKAKAPSKRHAVTASNETQPESHRSTQAVLAPRNESPY